MITGSKYDTGVTGHFHFLANNENISWVSSNLNFKMVAGINTLRNIKRYIPKKKYFKHC